MALPEDVEVRPQYTEAELINLWNDYMIEGARYGDEEDIHEALKNSAQVDAQDDDGRTALHMAAANGYTSIAQVLLKAGANTEMKNTSGNTALHWACVGGSASMVELLLGHGANPAALNTAGKAPIDSALDNDAICKVFQTHSANQDDSSGLESQAMLQDNQNTEQGEGGIDSASGSDDVADGVQKMNLN